MVIYKILEMTFFGEDDYQRGIESLQHHRLITANYPIHDGSYKWSQHGRLCYRQVCNLNKSSKRTTSNYIVNNIGFRSFLEQIQQVLESTTFG